MSTGRAAGARTPAAHRDRRRRRTPGHRRVRPRALAARARHAAVRVRRDRPAGACREYARRLRRRARVLRGQGVPVQRRWRGSSPRRGSTSTSPPAASSHVALHAGFPAARIVFHGNNKSDAELAAARSTPASGRIVADSFDELDRLEALVGAGAPRAARPRAGDARASRRTPTSTSRPAPTTRSSGSRSRTAARATPRCASSKSRGDGPSAASTATSGRRSSCSSRSPAAAAVVAELAADVARAHRRAGARDQPRRRARRAATPPTSSTPRASPSSDARRAPTSPTRARRSSSIPRPRSRSSRAARSPAPAGVTLYRVGTIKEIPGRAHLRRGRRRDERQPPPGALRRRLRGLPARRAIDRAPARSWPPIAGKHCEQGDLLVRDAHLPADVAVGDLLVTPVTGAYGYSMASQLQHGARGPRSCSCATGDARRRRAARDARRSRRARRRRVTERSPPVRETEG